MIVSSADLRHWLASQGEPVSDEAACIGRERDGRIVGVWALDRYTGTDCELTYAGEPGWVTPAMVRMVFDHIFGTLGCDRCTAYIVASNTRSLSIATRAGFRMEGTKRRARNGEDVHVLGMLKEECRFYGRRKFAEQGPANRPTGDDSPERAGQPRQHVRAFR